MRNSAARSDSGAVANRRDSSEIPIVIAPKVAEVPAHPLPFKGKLLSGDPAELPPAVAMSLSDTAPVTFTYREELTHDDYHVPLIISVSDPMTYSGAPLGDIGDDRICDFVDQRGRYDSRGLHRKRARLEILQLVRESQPQGGGRCCARRGPATIDQKLYCDEARLAHAVAGTGKSPTASLSQ